MSTHTTSHHAALSHPAQPTLSPEELEAALAVRDLTDPEQGPHALQTVVAEITDGLASAWGARLRIVRRDPVVDVRDNYERLGYPADAVTRDSRYSRYLDRNRMLRSHTSAMIPPTLDELAAEAAEANGAGSAGSGDRVSDVLLATPGLCYRRDSVDWQHTGTPQQMDLWRISTGRVLDDRELVAMIGMVVAMALPGRQWRTVPSPHPYTTGGRQIDVRIDGAHGGQWVEIGECGLADRRLLEEAGLTDSTGLAMGIGLDRILMLRKQIPDIRLLRATDPRIAEQMLDLAPYRPISHLPEIRRDLSIAVDASTDTSAEGLGDRVRRTLGDLADAVESVEPTTETGYEDLPDAARERLGIAPGQRNVLIRLVLRPLDRTLTDAEANLLRDRIYADLHEGSVHTWAAGTAL